MKSVGLFTYTKNRYYTRQYNARIEQWAMHNSKYCTNG